VNEAKRRASDPIRWQRGRGARLEINKHRPPAQKKAKLDKGQRRFAHFGKISAHDKKSEEKNKSLSVAGINFQAGIRLKRRGPEKRRSNVRTKEKKGRSLAIDCSRGNTRNYFFGGKT